MIARLLHGFTDHIPSTRCCGREWERLHEHRRFAHGEEVVIEERPFTFTLSPPFPEPPSPLPCFCGAPATHWVYQVMGDGQTINGLAVCAAHQEEA